MEYADEEVIDSLYCKHFYRVIFNHNVNRHMVVRLIWECIPLVY